MWSKLKHLLLGIICLLPHLWTTFIFTISLPYCIMLFSILFFAYSCPWHYCCFALLFKVQHYNFLTLHYEVQWDYLHFMLSSSSSCTLCFFPCNQSSCHYCALGCFYKGVSFLFTIKSNTIVAFMRFFCKLYFCCRC